MNYRHRKRLPSKPSSQPHLLKGNFMERQLRNHHSDPIREDNRPRVGRQRQEALELRRQSRPQSKYEITIPLGFSSRLGSGFIVAALWADKVRHVVGMYTFDQGRLIVYFNGNARGDIARSLHDSARLTYSAGDNESLVAWFVAEETR